MAYLLPVELVLQSQDLLHNIRLGVLDEHEAFAPTRRLVHRYMSLNDGPKLAEMPSDRRCTHTASSLHHTSSESPHSGPYTIIDRWRQCPHEDLVLFELPRA